MSERELARRVPTQADFDLFAKVSGDDNPIHVDPDFSARTRFGRTVSHGMLLYSWAWALLKGAFPRREPNVAQLMFPNPCYAGEEIRFLLSEPEAGLLKVRVCRAADDAELLTLETRLKEAGR
jgi:acyl dehydratase